MRVLWVSQKGMLGDLALQCAAALRRAGPRRSRQPGTSKEGHDALLWQPNRSVRCAHGPAGASLTPPGTGGGHSQWSKLVEASGWSDPRLGEAVTQTLPEILVLLAEPPSLWEVDALIGRMDLPGLVYLGSPGALRDSSVFRDLKFVERSDSSVRTAVPSEFLRRRLSTLKTGQSWLSLPLGVSPTLFRSLQTRDQLRRQAGLKGDFVVGCFARNREEDQLPSLFRAFKVFSADKPHAKLCLHVEQIRNPKSTRKDATGAVADQAGWDVWELMDRYDLHSQVKLFPLSVAGPYAGHSAPEGDPSDLGQEVSCRQKRLNRLYNLFDVFLVPGQGDGFGATILQAMSAGVPVVAVGYGLNRELVHSRGLVATVAARWLASPYGEERVSADEDHLVRQLQRLYDDETLRQRCILRGREFAESRSWDKVAVAWAQTLEVIESRSGRELAELERSREPCRARLEPGRARRFLVRRERGWGDLLFALSVAARLKELHPGAKVDAVTLPDYAEWVRWFDCIDSVYTTKPGLRYEKELDFEQTMDYAFNGDRAQGMGKLAGVEVTRLAPPPRIPLRHQRAARKRLASLRESSSTLASARPVIAFAPLAVKGTPNRSLTRTQTEGLLDALCASYRVVLLSAESLHGLDRANSASSASSASSPGFLNTSGQLTSAEAFALLNECDAFVGVDSGLLHAAAVLRKPVVGVFTHIPALHRLGCAERFIAFQPSLHCFACGDVWPQGPTGRHPPCRLSYRWSKQEPPLDCLALHRPDMIADSVGELLKNPDQRKVVNLDAEGRTTVWKLPLLDGAPDPIQTGASEPSKSVSSQPQGHLDLTSLIILNHNTWNECTRECVATALNNTVEPFEIVVVDNGSSPAEYRQIQRDLELTNSRTHELTNSASSREFAQPHSLPESEVHNRPSRVRLVRSAKNLGYPRGINRGLKASSPEARYVCLLNSDCYLREPRWNEKAAELFRRDWRLGALSLTKGEHRYFLDGETGQDYFFEAIESQRGDCEMLNGSCLLVDTRKVGPFTMDERFSPGSREDDDLSFWIRSQGWSLGQCQEFDVLHQRSRTLRKKGWRIRYEGKDYDYRELLERNRALLLGKWKKMLHPRLGMASSLSFLSRFYRPKVSVVLPTRDRLKSLGLTVTSILHQQLEDFELLMVTSCSEEAAALRKRYQEEDRIRVLTQRGRGIANARNTGMKAARGHYLAHMDDDEIWRPDHLKELAEHLDCNPSVGLVYADVRKSQGRYLRGRYVEHQDLGSPWCQPFDYERFKTGNWIPSSAAMQRASLLEEVGYFDESFHYADDWDYWLRIAQSQRVAHCCTLKELGYATVEYRIHGGNATLRDQDLWGRDFERIAQRYGT